MENFNLNDEEQKVFGEWFSNLDKDKQAKLNFKNVTQFLSSAYQLTVDDLEKIFNICGAKRLGFFGRSQFYIALKFVSLAQNSHELTLENLNKSNLPLPKFNLNNCSFNDDFDKLNYDQKKIDHIQLNSIDSFTNSVSQSTCILPPPPSSASKSNRLKRKQSPSQVCKFCNKNLITIDQEQVENLKSFVLICSNCKNSNQNSPPVELINNQSNLRNLSDLNSSSDNSRCSSTELYETIDHNSLAFEKLKTWQKIESNQVIDDDDADSADESKHCLLNDDEELIVDTNKICLNVNNNYDAINNLKDREYELSTINYENKHNEPINYDSTNFHINQIEEENEEDVFLINDEQIKFYFDKFCQLLPCKTEPFLAGSHVKSFFEKSKLSLDDLKNIWSLSDIDCDGNLTVIEFCIAMHLVVLKRNKVPLPNSLPISLSPIKINFLLEKNQLKFEAPLSTDKLNDKLSDRLNDKDYSTTDSSNSLPSYHHISINISNDNISKTNLSSLRNSFDSDYFIKNDHNKMDFIIKHGLHNQEMNASIAGNTNQPLSTGEQEITIYSPNREWTKFNNSPYTTTKQSSDKQQNLNNQINLRKSTSNDANFLMTPANFDKIELDPKLIHPLPVKVISSTNQINSSLLNKDGSNRALVNPQYPPRPSGHARSSSLDLTRKMINSSITANNIQNHGAFTNYRKHIQQQISKTDHQFDLNQIKNSTSPNLDKQYYLNYLKTKYVLPKQPLETTTDPINLVKSVKERMFLIECVYDQLIDELASTLEQLANYQQKNYR